MIRHPSRRQRAWGVDTVGVVNPTPLGGTLAVHHSEHLEVPLLCSRGGTTNSTRNRRRGSPFAALSDAYKPPRVWLAASTGRGSGEVVSIRSSDFAWPVRLPPVAADTLKLRRDLPLSQTDVPAHTGIDGKDEERQADTPTTSKVEEKVGKIRGSQGKAGEREMEGAGKDREAKEPADPSNLMAAPSRGGERPAGHKRRVTWSGTVETREVARMTSCDIFSPDLLSLEVAKRLAILNKDPKLACAVEAVTFIRRKAAGTIRSLTARHDWNGSLDGVEEACRVWTSKEGAYLRELDELVRCAVSIGSRYEDGDGKSAQDVWKLKATYREARRKMEDAESD